MIRTLDLREQKSKNFIPDAFPGIKVKKMKHGDYEAYILVPIAAVPSTKSEIECYSDHMGNLCFRLGNVVEYKDEDDFNLKNGETIGRFRDETRRIGKYCGLNPYVQPQAIWRKTDIWKNPLVWIEKLGEYRNQIAVFFTMCQDYDIRGHVVETEEQVVALLKRLDQPKSYIKHKPFIKRTKEPTDLARAIRVPKGVSSDIAIQLSECQSFNEIMAVKGMMKKDGHATKLWDKINNHLGILKDFWFIQWHGGQDHI